MAPFSSTMYLVYKPANFHGYVTSYQRILTWTPSITIYTYIYIYIYTCIYIYISVCEHFTPQISEVYSTYNWLISNGYAPLGCALRIGETLQRNPWTEDWVDFFREQRLRFQARQDGWEILQKWGWVNTYRYNLLGDEHSFTSNFDVH